MNRAGRAFDAYINGPVDEISLVNEVRTEIILVRHGQAIPADMRQEKNLLNPGLSELGVEQANSLGEFFANKNISAVYSSPLNRAIETASPIAMRLGVDIVTISDLEEVRLLGGINEYSKDVCFDPSEWRVHGERFVSTGRWDAFPVTEDSGAFRSRVRSALDTIATRHRNERIIVTCHGGVINVYAADILGLAADYFFRAAHCSLTRVWVGEDRKVISSLNEIGHLPAGLLTI